ncbi:sugar transferase [Cellulomonas bogoriensis]|uniref:Polyprenyl glycosylphosphotransferase n=1 Tax=Cellulomonas bogoriensis 69B4 = DSM 16987 TaxID=1386082 RepID=A0A0A0C1I2_9CELL|nr:sugar transferase [Cellulomonas bogoriensis]KGM14071.1 polyprenyl glycosylphosphotransferase [Cellulomonas bogoriensis 69B4 = DSM 16987]
MNLGALSHLPSGKTAAETTASSTAPQTVSPSIPAAAQRGASCRKHHDAWLGAYVRTLVVLDALVVTAAMLIAYVLRFEDATWSPPTVAGSFSPSYLAVSVVLATAWFAALELGRTRDHRELGSGPTEYARVFRVSWQLFALVAIIAFVLRLDMARGYLAIAFPVGVVMLLGARHLARRRLVARRRAGSCMTTVLVVGEPPKAADLIEQLGSNPASGHHVRGVCVTSSAPMVDEVAGVPVLGGISDVVAAAEQIGADKVAVTGSEVLTSKAVRQLSWDLEGSGVELALAPGLAEVASPRVQTSLVNGTALVHVDEPQFSGSKYFIKSVTDWVAALVLTVALAPALVGIAALVKMTSPGPVFYKQERIGRNGVPFLMWKFRSMSVGAHEMRHELSHLDEGQGALFKVKDDPRVTPVGRVIRRYSLDELPQLFNVLRGEMSLVGPRPNLPDEVSTYERHVHRRLYVKPGLTGLWQVSGRSELSWEESVRLDLYYAENWTPFGDFLVLLRTIKVIISPTGAY